MLDTQSVALEFKAGHLSEPQAFALLAECGIVGRRAQNLLFRGNPNLDSEEESAEAEGPRFTADHKLPRSFMRRAVRAAKRGDTESANEYYKQAAELVSPDELQVLEEVFRFRVGSQIRLIDPRLECIEPPARAGFAHTR